MVSRNAKELEVEETQEEVLKIVEEVIKNPDDLFPSFSEEMAEKARNELIKAFEQKLAHDLSCSPADDASRASR